MSLGSILSSLPVIRRAWRMVPGPWRLPLLIVGLGWWIYQRVSSDADASAEA